MKRILVVGSYNTDLVICGDRIPRSGETVMSERFFTAPGGKGSNQAITAARLGGSVSFLCRIGSDGFAGQARDLFATEGLPAAPILSSGDCATGVAMIIVDRVGKNAIAVAPGANGRLSIDDVRSHRHLFELSDIVLVQLEVPLATSVAAMRLAKELGKFVILNPAPAQLLDRDVLALADVLTPNETEAQILTGMSVDSPESANAAATALRSGGARAVIITLGEQGCVLVNDDGARHLPAYDVRAIDTTGAGDAFNGGLAYALANGQGLADAADFASRVAACSVQARGVIDGLPRLHQVTALAQRKATTPANAED